MSTRVRELDDPRAAVALVVLVFGAACLALGVTAPGPTEVVTWWPAVGVAAMLATLTRRSWWSWVLPLVVVANGSANMLYGRPWDLALILAVVVAGEGAAFAVVMRHRPSGLANMATQRDFLRMVVAAGASATVGGLVAAVAIPGLVGTGSFRNLLTTIPPSHAAAMLVIAPVALSWRRSLLPIRPFELALQSAVLAVTALTAFWFTDVLAMTFVPLPFLVWAAFKFGLRVVAWQLAFIALIATGSTARGHGPFAVGFASDNLSLLSATSLVQTFLVCMVLICVPLAVNVEQGRRLLERVRASSELFRQNFSESLLSILVLRVGEGRLEIFDANTTSASLLGRRVHDLVGLPLEAVVETDTPMAEVTESMLQGSLDLIEQLVGIVLAALQLRDDDRALRLAVVGVIQAAGHPLGLDEQHPIERVARRGLEIGRLVDPGVAVPAAAELLDDALHLIARDVGRALEVHVLDPVRDAGQSRALRPSIRPCTSTTPTPAARCAPPERAPSSRCRASSAERGVGRASAEVAISSL